MVEVGNARMVALDGLGQEMVDQIGQFWLGFFILIWSNGIASIKLILKKFQGPLKYTNSNVGR